MVVLHPSISAAILCVNRRLPRLISRLLRAARRVRDRLGLRRVRDRQRRRVPALGCFLHPLGHRVGRRAARAKDCAAQGAARHALGQLTQRKRGVWVPRGLISQIIQRIAYAFFRGLYTCLLQQVLY